MTLEVNSLKNSCIQAYLSDTNTEPDWLTDTIGSLDWLADLIGEQAVI